MFDRSTLDPGRFKSGDRFVKIRPVAAALWSTTAFPRPLETTLVLGAVGTVFGRGSISGPNARSREELCDGFSLLGVVETDVALEVRRLGRRGFFQLEDDVVDVFGLGELGKEGVALGGRVVPRPAPAATAFVDVIER